MASQDNITHEEIWDDSVLVDSWNDALEEYKKYHSIKARGENPQEVLTAHDEQIYHNGGGPDFEDGEVARKSDHDLPAKQNMPDETEDHLKNAVGNVSTVKDKHSNPAVPSAQTSDGGPREGPPALPQHMIGQVHDEGLKNLLMSWYYAGYYTGLYEGQQQGTQVQKAKHEI